MAETSIARTAFRVRPVHPRLAFQILAQGGFFIWLPVFFGAGVGTYFSLLFEPPADILPWIAFAGLIAPVLGLFWPTALMAGWACCFAAMGFSAAGWQTYRVAAPVLEYRYYGPIEGRVVGLDRSASDKLRVTLDQVRLDRVAPLDRPLRVRVSLHGEQRFLDPQPGQIVMTTGHLSPPSGPVEPGAFDFQRHAWFLQLGGVGYTRVPMLLQHPGEGGGLSVRLFRLRMAISGAIKANMPAREGAFAAAILTGDRSDIDQDALAALRASNLAHLLAISGLHMGLLTGVVFTLVRFGFALTPPVAMRTDPKKIAAVAAFVVAVSYLALSGANVATQRAFIMVSVMLGAVCLDRRALTLRAVAIAALIVLVAAPSSLAGPGFQMSFAATTALVAVFAELRDRQVLYGWPKWARNLASLVISSAIAGLATAPFGALHFNQMSQWGLIANLLSVPVMGAVVMPGAVMAAVLSTIGLEQLGFALMHLGLHWILIVAEAVSSFDSALRYIPAPGGWVLPLLGLAGALLCLLRGYGRLSGVAALALALGLWSQAERPAILISDTGTLIGIMTPEGRALNKAKGEGFVASAWLENDGDPVDQEGAYARLSLPRKDIEVPLGGQRLRYVLDKEHTEAAADDLCRGVHLLVLPETEARPDCPSLIESDFRKGGATAIHETPDGLTVTTARDLRGTRIWAH